MSRRKLIRYKDGAYHVNAKTNNSEWFPLPLKDCWYIFGYYLKKMNEKYNVQIHAFTLMSNHFHLLCSTPDENLDRAMNYFMTMTSKGISLAAARNNHLYGTKYYWTHASHSVGYAALYKYILRNPLRANLCKSIEMYPWTTFNSNHFNFELQSNLLEDLIPTQNIKGWLNLCPQNFDEKIFKKILRSKEFKIPISRATRRKITFDTYI